jgi:predicted Zn-dependent protease
MLDEKQARELVDRVLARSKAEEATVAINGGRTTHLRFARNTPSTSGTYNDVRLSIESAYGKRSAEVSINQFDDQTIEAAVRRSEELARLAPEDPEAMPALEPQRYESVKGAQSIDHEALPKTVATCIQSAVKEKVVVAGIHSVLSGSSTFANSKGLFAHHHYSHAYLAQTARTPDGQGSGWSAGVGNKQADIDPARLSKIAIEKAKRSQKAEAMPPGKYVTILEPACVASLLQILLGRMDARTADEGRSYFAKKGGQNRVGELLFPSNINIWSDPADDRVPGRPWGEDGLPQARQSWIKNGRVEALRTSRFWAKKSGTRPIPAGTNVIMEGGKGEIDELVASTERGILVTSFWYIRDVDPESLLLTGLTRDGVFWIENGKIVRPVKNFRWNDSPVAMLKNIVAMSKSERVAARDGGGGAAVVPALKVKQFAFTSASDAV